MSVTLSVVEAADIRSLVPMSEAIGAVRLAFEAFGRGEFSALRNLADEDGTFVVKSVVHRPSQTMVVKSLTVDSRRRPLVSGVVAMLDRAAGTEVVADAGTVTTMRTGAVVGLATDLLAAPGARRLVLIGAGAQAADQFRAVLAVRPLESLTVVDSRPERAHALLDQLGDDLVGIETHAATTASSAVADAEIVCCATSASSPLFALDDLPRRVHVNAIGSFRPSMRELPAELLADATVVVDHHEAVRHEAGEIVHGLRTGLIDESDLTDLSDALRHPPPSTPRSVFKTVGIAVQDWALMRAVGAALASRA